jgi:uncharacterized damage-inducible protein DinB
MNIKEILIEQMHSCHDQTGWFVAVNKALLGLTAEQAAWKDGSSNNSIWQLVNHLIFWNENYLNRFKGIPDSEYSGDNDSTFEGEKTSGTQDQWRETVEKLNSVLTRWENEMENADEEKFDQPAKKNEDYSWASYIATINAHIAYHIGQIVTLRKLQGSWDKKQGVT